MPRHPGVGHGLAGRPTVIYFPLIQVQIVFRVGVKALEFVVEGASDALTATRYLWIHSSVLEAKA